MEIAHRHTPPLLVSGPPWALKEEFPSSFSRDRPDQDVASKERHFAQVNSEDRGAPAKLVEAFRTSCDDKIHADPPSLRGNTTSPKTICGSHCQNGKGRAEDFATKLG